MDKRRKDFSREEFLSHVWKWKEENEYHILEQLKAGLLLRLVAPALHDGRRQQPRRAYHVQEAVR